MTTMIGWARPIPIGVGDGSTLTWQVTDLGGFAIALPAGAQVLVNGAAAPSYTDNGSGALTFAVALAAGAVITMQPPADYADRAWMAQTAVRSYKPNLYLAKFGDGYEQATPNGINFLPEKWDNGFTFATRADAEEFDAYLRSYGGYLAFTWRSPRGPSPIRVKCRGWSDIDNVGQKFTITATFEQVFGQ